MKLNELRNFIRIILEEKEEQLLGEPDLSSEEEREDDEELDDYGKSKNEQNAISTGGGAIQNSGQIAGVITPLGTGPAYPADAPRKKKKKKEEDEDEDWYKT